MATSKLLKPTNVTIQIPEFTDQPDQRVNSNCLDKEADAINALNDQAEGTQTRFKYYTLSSGQTITLNGTGGLAIFNSYGTCIVAIKSDGTKQLIYEEATGGSGQLTVSQNGNTFTIKSILGWNMPLNLIWNTIVN